MENLLEVEKDSALTENNEEEKKKKKTEEDKKRAEIQGKGVLKD